MINVIIIMCLNIVIIRCIIYCRYRSIPPVNTLILTSGIAPFMGFHYALEGGTTPPLQDVARAVANKIKSALPLVSF